MAQRHMNKLIDSLAKQGCRVRKTKAGVFLFCPDGVTTLGFHTSNHSDRRTMANIRSDVQKAGLTWPAGVPG